MCRFSPGAPQAAWPFQRVLHSLSLATIGGTPAACSSIFNNALHSRGFYTTDRNSCRYLTNVESLLHGHSGDTGPLGHSVRHGPAVSTVPPAVDALSVGRDSMALDDTKANSYSVLISALDEGEALGRFCAVGAVHSGAQVRTLHQSIPPAAPPSFLHSIADTLMNILTSQ